MTRKIAGKQSHEHSAIDLPSADTRPMDMLLAIMTKLRTPDVGCPWDLAQDFSTIAPYTIEEAYEVADAIDRNDLEDLRDELGDLLFQVVFHAQIARERGAFNFDDVAAAISNKMIRRHPHVFEAQDGRDAAAQTHAWEEMKAAERRDKAQSSAMDNIPSNLPALIRAAKLQKRAARVGFDWSNSLAVLDKMQEELDELRAAVAGEQAEPIAEELGDFFFASANLARHLNLDADACLRAANQKFARRFRDVEQQIAEQGLDINRVSQETLERAWEQAKRREKDQS